MKKQLRKSDALGHAIQAYLAGNSDSEIIIHSSITEEDVIPVKYLFRTEAQMPELELKALELCKGAVLDIGAGAGSHALVLQEKGFAVTALDSSAGAVEAMKQRGIKKAVKSDFFKYKSKTFDTLLLLMNGIGLAGTLDGLDQFLNHAKTLLNPGGQILLDSSDILYMFEQEDGSVWVDLNGAYYGQVQYQMEFESSKTKPFDWLFVDFFTLQDHAENGGFNCEMIFQDQNDQYLARLTIPAK